jgi:cephalosporin hydroxylase
MDNWNRNKYEYFKDYVKPTKLPKEHFDDWVKYYKAWDGAGIAQLPEQVRLLLKIVEDFEIQTVIELGIMGGGMSLMMLDRKAAYPGFEYYGVEIETTYIHEKVRHRPEIIIGDVFDANIWWRINNIIQDASGTVLVFCDNGNKPEELHKYAPLIRVGDYIMAHDYPGEVNDEFLSTFYNTSPLSLYEVDRQLYRDYGYVLFRRMI